jgi:hypothetical protein
MYKPKGIRASGNKRTVPFTFIYRCHEKEFVGQLQDLAASSLDYEAGLFPDAIWTL